MAICSALVLWSKRQCSIPTVGSPSATKHSIGPWGAGMGSLGWRREKRNLELVDPIASGCATY